MEYQSWPGPGGEGRRSPCGAPSLVETGEQARKEGQTCRLRCEGSSEPDPEPCPSSLRPCLLVALGPSVHGAGRGVGCGACEKREERLQREVETSAG